MTFSALFFALIFATAASAARSELPSLGVQQNDEICARIMIASAEGKKIDPKDPALSRCGQATKNVCQETRDFLIRTPNRDAVKNCSGQKYASAGGCGGYHGDNKLGALNPATTMWRCRSTGDIWADKTVDGCNKACPP